MSRSSNHTDPKAASEAWNQLGLGVQFLWSKVPYEVTKWPGTPADPFVADVCQIRRMGKGGKLFGPVRRFIFENCLIELPEILRGKDES